MERECRTHRVGRLGLLRSVGDGVALVSRYWCPSALTQSWSETTFIAPFRGQPSSPMAKFRLAQPHPHREQTLIWSTCER